MYQRSNDRPGPAPGAAQSPCSAASPSPSSRSSSSGSGTCRCSPARQYLAEAKNNRTREYKVIAPRGDILDRDGNVLVDNRTSLALQLNTQKLPEDPAEEKAELARLGAARPHVAAQDAADDHRRGRSRRRGAGDAAQGRRLRPRLLPAKRTSARFPGVTVQRVFVRDYPDGTRAAHVVGSVGEVSEEELKEAAVQGPRAGRRGRQGRGRVHLRPATCAASRG